MYGFRFTGWRGGDFEGTVGATDRKSLRLCAFVEAQRNSVFQSINRALKMMESITKFSENEMEEDERVDNKDDEDMLDVKSCIGGHNMKCTTHAHSLLFPNIFV